MEAQDSPRPPALQVQMQQVPAKPPGPSMVSQQPGSLSSFYHHLHSGVGVFSQQQLLHQQHQQAQQQASQHPQTQQQQQQQQQQQFSQQQQQQQRVQTSTGIRNHLLPSIIHSPAAMRHNTGPNPTPSPTLNPNVYPPQTPPHMIPHSMSTSSSPPSGVGVGTGLSTAMVLSRADSAKRKRGRPRKYTNDANGTPLLQGSTSPLVKKASRGPAKKNQLSNYGARGQGFTPHVLKVEAGEDVTSKIMFFLQQGPWAVCILSANGAISNASLRHAGISSSSVMYEGRFEVLSLSGLFLLSEIGGAQSRTGGLSVSLAGPDGRVIGGKVAGLLMAASPVQIILGTFLQANHKSQVRAGNVGAKPLDSQEKDQLLPAAEHEVSMSMRDQTSNSLAGNEKESPSHVIPLQSADWGGSQFDLETSGHNEM